MTNARFLKKVKHIDALLRKEWLAGNSKKETMVNRFPYLGEVV